MKEKYGAQIAEDVTQYLKGTGLLNDDAFARERARHLAVNRVRGNRAIEADLLRKGIDRTLIFEAIQAAREELSEAAAIRTLLEKRKPSLSSTKRAWREKTGRYLLSKGFPAGVICEILNE
ncbi:MAG: regulatory protein RecX [Syntrophales bacterium]